MPDPQPNSLPTAPPEVIDAGNNAPPIDPGQPATPRRETFGGGFRRGAAGETYATDAQGNVVNARMTRPSFKGTLGSILAGATMGALAGVTQARPGGIPSHELGGGPGQGAGAADEYFKQRDAARRGVAQQNLQNRMAVTKSTNEDLRNKAELHMVNLQTLRYAHDLDVAQREDPYRFESLKNAALISSVELDSKAADLGLINPREYRDYSDVPQADIDKFNQHGAIKLITLPGGGIRVYDRTFDPRTTPNKGDFEIRDLMGFDENGKPQWKVAGHVDAGKGTVAQMEAELEKETKQTYDMAYKQAEASAGKERQNDLDLYNKSGAKNRGVTFTEWQAERRSAGEEQGKTVAAASEARDTARLIVNGDLASVRDITSFRGNQRQELFKALDAEARAQGKDPKEFSPARLESKARTLQDYTDTSRPNSTARNITSFNTFVEHTGAALDSNANFLRPNNKLADRSLAWLYKNAAQNQEFKDFQVALIAPAKEFMNFLNANRAEHVEDIAKMDQALSDSSTPREVVTALKGVMRTAGIRLNELDRTFERNLGSSYERYMNTPMTSPEASRVLQRYGLAPKPVANIPSGKVPFHRSATDSTVIGYADDANGTNYVSLDKLTSSERSKVKDLVKP